MSELEGKTSPGRFFVGGREVHGELTVQGNKSNLYLYDEAFFNAHADGLTYIHGISSEHHKVSLFGCLCPGTGHGNRNGETYNFANVFPHHVLVGDHHLSPNDTVIESLSFIVDDAKQLFYDFDAFGYVIDAEKVIQAVVEANKIYAKREIATGPDPHIAYFTGKTEIFRVKTAVGEIAAIHNPRTPIMGGPDGVIIKNFISIEIKFEQPIAFYDAIERLLELSKFLELLAGRQQNYEDIALTISIADEVRSRELHLDWSMGPKRKEARNERSVQAGDILMDAVGKPENFGSVLAKWIEKRAEWKVARDRFSSSFRKGHYYDIDRLIGAANVFDIIPDSELPAPPQIENDLAEAKSKTQALFKGLPASPDRDAVLSILARLGKLTLKKKIASRVARILDGAPDKFPELLRVAAEAVNCRNYYVHGSSQNFDYDKNTATVWFFVDTLEFIFGASDLIDAGWDFKEWLSKGSTMSHPFDVYKIEYMPRLAKLRGLLTPTVS